MLSISKMKPSDIDRIGEIDRTEHLTQGYEYKSGELGLKDVHWNVPSWLMEGDGDHSVQGNINAWKPILEIGGTMWGAFDGDKLVGFAIYRPRLSENMAQFAVLHISSGNRRCGIGTNLSNEVIEKARVDGMENIYVSSVPSKPTVEFYRKLGFKLADEVNHELYELEPEDIHMILEL